MKRFFVLVGFIFFFMFASSQHCLSKSSLQYGYIVLNEGQWDEEVLLQISTKNYVAWLVKDGLVFNFISSNTNLNSNLLENKKQIHVQSAKITFNFSLAHHTILGFCQLPGYHNYLIGNNPSKWRTHVPLFKDVVIQNPKGNRIKLGINFNDLEIKFEQSMEDFSLNKITLESQLPFEQDYQTLTLFTTKGRCNITFDTTSKTMSIQFLPFIISNKSTISDSLVYSSYFGSIDYETATAIEVDQHGYIYLGGLGGANFPVTSGSFQTIYGGTGDVFVSKFNPITSELIFSTFIGGNNSEGLHDLALDADGNIIVVGWTSSTNFPTSSNAIMQTFNGEFDGFITKLNPTGTDIVFSTYFGGSSSDYCRSVDVDKQKNIYVAGITSSTDIPITLGSFQIQLANWTDGFVSKLNPEGNQLIYSTYLGGISADNITALAVDSEGYAYLTGKTSSDNFPTTQGVFQPVHANANSYDIFVTKLNQTGSALVFSTLLGGSSDDEAEAITIDNLGHIYVTGTTSSNDFPITNITLQNHNRGNEDVFVSCINENATQLLFSTFWGGTSSEKGRSIKIDPMGYVYVFGNTQSTDFPTSSFCLQPSFGGGNYDAFLLAFHPADTNYVYATLLGGTHDDYGIDLKVVNHGEIYLTGSTQSTDFPTTTNPYQSTNLGGLDVYIVKIHLQFPNQHLKPNYSTLPYHVFPNPSTGSIHIYSSKQTDIEVYDFSGKLLLQQTITSPYTVIHLPEGIYTIKDRASSHIEKIIVY